MCAGDSHWKRAEITVTGVVQAVGFRPFVYRRATAHGLGGSVRNTGAAGVEITLEGREGDLEAFLKDLRERPPPLAAVEQITVDERPISPDSTSEEFRLSFEIVESTNADDGSGTIPPDTGICAACLEDVRDPNSRYHGYWATSCVDCGPRYTVIETLPYDRPRTTMRAFPMCDDCREEYEDPSDRRYHAQTIACPACGPTLSLLSADRDELASARTALATGTAAISATSERLQNGGLVAIRGIGGTHLACLATDVDAVSRLRERTGRPAKPFALMAPETDTVREFARVGETERELLETVRRPVVVLERDDRQRTEPWLEAVAPGLHTVGVMLPYAGLHHLLFDTLDSPLVMTSANLPGQPMATTVDALFESLGGVIDAALVHDRAIHARCDDSVVRVVDGNRRFLRRSRGWVPRPLPRPADGPPVLALGAEFDTVVGLARDDEVILSQHLGDVDDPDTEGFLRETVEHLTELFGVEPALVACDRHPDFVTSKLAETYAEGTQLSAVNDLVRVHHHHAHAAGLLAEHAVDATHDGEHDRERALVIAADGTGYGRDGTIWGGEVLDVTYDSFERVGGLGIFRLPGGEAAVRHPGRILASLLPETTQNQQLIADRTPLSVQEVQTLWQSLEADVNAPQTTSAGRFLDAISALLDVCTVRRYQGEPAVRLEAAGEGATPLDISPSYVERNGYRVLDVDTLTRELAERRETHSTARLAATAQDVLARGLASIAVREADRRDVSHVGFTGGVAYNEAISRRIRQTVEANELEYLGHDRVPPGDAGIAYGQVVVATARR